MLGHVMSGRSGSLAQGRSFRYEVAGLRQSDETTTTAYPIRSSASTFITVPYHRMNDEMLRIARLGGKIVNITPL